MITAAISEPVTNTSICWNCKSGRADRCKWISQKKRVWKRAEEKKCCHTQSVWTVLECKHYEPESSERRQKAPKPQKNKTAGRPYTSGDDALIKKMRRLNIPCDVIADKLGRSRGAIYRRISRLKTEGEMEAVQA